MDVEEATEEEMIASFLNRHPVQEPLIDTEPCPCCGIIFKGNNE